MSAKSVILALSGAVMLTTVAAPAAANTKEDVRDLQARMERVEQSAAAQSAASVRIGELEREMQELTGRIEELTYRLEQANARLDAVSAVLAGDAMPAVDTAAPSAPYGGPAVRSGPVDLSTGAPVPGAASGVDASPPAIGPSAIAVELPLDPNAAYDYASGFLLAGDYQRARAAFDLYVQAFPNHPRTPDAQFRLGEIHLALGENAAAADAFIAHIRNYPNDPRAAEAYLKLGTAFSRLEKSDEACTVFKTMKSKFPNATEPVRQRADLEMARINCK